MPIYQFKQESWRYYRVKARDKETAERLLLAAQDDPDGAGLYSHFDREETALDFEFDGEFECGLYETDL